VILLRLRKTHAHGESMSCQLVWVSPPSTHLLTVAGLSPLVFQFVSTHEFETSLQAIKEGCCTNFKKQGNPSKVMHGLPRQVNPSKGRCGAQQGRAAHKTLASYEHWRRQPGLHTSHPLSYRPICEINKELSNPGRHGLQLLGMLLPIERHGPSTHTHA